MFLGTVAPISLVPTLSNLFYENEIRGVLCLFGDFLEPYLGTSLYSENFPTVTFCIQIRNLSFKKVRKRGNFYQKV